MFRRQDKSHYVIMIVGSDQTWLEVPFGTPLNGSMLYDLLLFVHQFWSFQFAISLKLSLSKRTVEWSFCALC
jgi:hypothetical protein